MVLPLLLAAYLYSRAIYTWLLDEFHAKHGRDRGGRKGGKPRKKSVCISDTPVSADAVSRQRKNYDKDGSNSNQDRVLPKVAGETRKPKDNKVGTPLPAIGPSPPAAPGRNTEGAGGGARRRSMFAGQDNAASTADSGSSVGGDGESGVTFPTQVTPLHLCVCCGAEEGGLGHGRRCAHTSRRCGFCRVQEVKRVLGIYDTDRRGRRGTGTSVREESCAIVLRCCAPKCFRCDGNTLLARTPCCS